MAHEKYQHVDSEILQSVLDMINRTAEMGESYVSIVNSFSEPNLNALISELECRGFTIHIVPNYVKISWD